VSEGGVGYFASGFWDLDYWETNYWPGQLIFNVDVALGLEAEDAVSVTLDASREIAFALIVDESISATMITNPTIAFPIEVEFSPRAMADFQVALEFDIETLQRFFIEVIKKIATLILRDHPEWDAKLGDYELETLVYRAASEVARTWRAQVSIRSGEALVRDTAVDARLSDRKMP
jgi:hypothetical protein